MLEEKKNKAKTKRKGKEVENHCVDEKEDAYGKKSSAQK